MPRTKNAVAKRNTTAVAESEVPEYLKNNDIDDNIESSDIVIPRLKICQAMSKIKNDIEIKEGDLYNSMTQEVYGQKLSMFVLLYWKNIVWFSEDFKMLGALFTNRSGQEIWAGSDVEHCKQAPEDGKDSFNYMVVTADELMDMLKTGSVSIPSIFSCMSAALSGARQLNGKIKVNSMKKIPMYAQLVNIETVKKSFPKGSAFVPQFSYGRYATEEEFALLARLRESAKAMQDAVSAQVETEPEDADSDVSTDLPETPL